ncbi:T9SS type A sorting domain-containing protein [Phaeocystidibacter luteus]|uniref:T9SS type A sorting domain-containing protein n=1 Tax=Phaeocystidibacter luteus TaxID=911197 RepID=A0A6N6RIP2_9FLAO|nr:T9SS type A sorting domain-containing protein [Phaeocystidibacter luteus]KAB2804289.1 T9SS type A sorting domain-containing protein [Phaeocystidibacter luteus]
MQIDTLSLMTSSLAQLVRFFQGRSKLLLLIVVVSLSFHCEGQEIDIRYSHDDYVSGMHTMYLDGSIYYVKSIASGFEYRSAYQDWLIKSDLNLNPVDSINLYRDSADLSLITSISSYSDTIECIYLKYHAGACWYETKIDYYDTSFNYLGQIELGDSANSVSLVGSIAGWNGNRYYYGYAVSCPSFSEKPIIVEKLRNGNTRFDTINVVIQRGAVRAMIKHDSGYVAILYIHNTLGFEWVVLDDSLSHQSSGATALNDFVITDLIGLTEVNGDLVLIGPSVNYRILPFARDYWNTSVLKFNASSGVQSIDTLHVDGEFNFDISGNGTIGAGMDAFDGTKKDSAIFVQSNTQVLTWEWSNPWKNTIFIYNYNLQSGMLNWQSEYRIEGIIGSNASVSTLPRNRVLVSNYEFVRDSLNPTAYNLQLHLMILDSTGRISLEKTHHPPILEAIVSPNPAKDFIKVSVEESTGLRNLKYTIMDVQGRIVQSGVLNTSGVIEFGHRINSGYYLLELSSRRRHRIDKIQVNR